MNSSFFNDSNSLLGTNSTHLNFTYVENPLAQYFYLSLIQTFTLVFLGEIGDQIFILMIILELKSQSPTTVFFSSLLSFSLINTISIILGSSIDILLYQNLIDILAILIFGITGINLLLKWFEYGNKTYEEEIFNCIKGEIENEELQKNVIRSRFYESSKRDHHFININNEELKEPLIFKKESFDLTKSLGNTQNQNNNTTIMSSSNILDQKKKIDTNKNSTILSGISNNSVSIGLEIIDEPPTIMETPTVQYPDDFKKLNIKKQNEVIEEFFDEEEDEELNNNEKNYFWIFFKTLLITVFADSTQVGVLASSSIYNANGVIFGSFFAIFFICFIAAYYNETFARELKGRNMCIVNGFIFFALALEIYYFSKNFNPL